MRAEIMSQLIADLKRSNFDRNFMEQKYPTHSCSSMIKRNHSTQNTKIPESATMKAISEDMHMLFNLPH